jgi:hypothetical protein
MGEECLYAVRIKHLLFDAELRVYFSTKQKKYAIYSDNGLWLETEDGVRCKLLYFVVSDDVMTAFVEGECRLADNDWTFLNKWEKEG